MINAYIGLGSNLENPADQVKKARSTIAAHPLFTELKFSSLYSSPPMGPQNQPDYVNAVMSISTDSSGIEVLRILQKIESDFGRVRDGERWGARILDLDLLIFGDQMINHPDLIVPHAGLSERAFVLSPLSEITPENMSIPGLGTLSHLLSHCPPNGLEKIL